MASSNTDSDVILIAVVLLSGAVVNEHKTKANKYKKSNWTHRCIEQCEKYGAYHSLVRKRK